MTLQRAIEIAEMIEASGKWIVQIGTTDRIKWFLRAMPATQSFDYEYIMLDDKANDDILADLVMTAGLHGTLATISIDMSASGTYHIKDIL